MLLLKSPGDLEPSRDALKSEQRAHPKYGPIIEFLEGRSEEQNVRAARESRKFTLNNEILMRKEFSPNTSPYFTVALPENLVPQLLPEYHDNKLFGGHMGKNKLFEKIRKKYYAPKLMEICANYVKTCEACQRTGKNVSGKKKSKSLSQRLLRDPCIPSTWTPRGNTVGPQKETYTSAP